MPPPPIIERGKSDDGGHTYGGAIKGLGWIKTEQRGTSLFLLSISFSLLFPLCVALASSFPTRTPKRVRTLTRITTPVVGTVVRELPRRGDSWYEEDMAIDKKIIPPSEDYAPVPPVVEAGGGSQAPEERQQEGAGEQEQEREQRPVSPYRDEPSQSYEGAPPSYGCVPASNAHANSTATGIAERDIESDPDEGQLPTSKQARRQRRRKICWRFTRAFVWALGFWFVIRLFVDGVRWIDDSGHIQAGWRDWPVSNELRG